MCRSAISCDKYAKLALFGSTFLVQRFLANIIGYQAIKPADNVRLEPVRVTTHRSLTVNR